MALTIWEQDLRQLADQLRDALDKADPEYQRLMAALAEKDPTITAESVAATIKR